MSDDTKAILGALRTQTGEWQEPEWSVARRLQAAATIERLERELADARAALRELVSVIDAAPVVTAKSHGLRFDAALDAARALLAAP